MLLHSPSGAGKTSLIQTSVVPAFGSRDFLICATTEPDFAALRVNLPPPIDTSVRNRYVFSVVNGLIGQFTDRERAYTMSVVEAVEEFVQHQPTKRRQLLVLDQLEEVLTIEPGDVEGQTEFFKQLGTALDDSRRWGLLAIREDYMGALDRFRQYLPGQLRSTARLDFLDQEAALRAVQEPARECRVEFEDSAAHMLVNDLRLVRSGYEGEDVPAVKQPYVEPVLLQVVCYSLFARVRKDQGADLRAITVKDVEKFRPFDKSIAKYYRTVIREVAADNRDVERALREWVEHKLISKKRLRRQTRQKPSVNDPDTVLSAMIRRYLIRDDPRPGGPPLWELSHDLLVGPILDDNRAWRAKRLEPWQSLAEEWRASDRDPQYLLEAGDHIAAQSHSRRVEVTENERAFLKASLEAIYAHGRLARLRAQIGVFGALLALSFLVNIVLLLVLWKLS
jgi:hypothetical protein